jgi:UTP:GlnB (protein PII) uridylyltransferase
MASMADVLGVLGSSPIPPEAAARLVAEASELWLLSAPADVLAGDLAQCHPPLGPDEARVGMRPTGPEQSMRIAVVAHDRAGLLAGTAGVLAAHGLTVVAASVTTWSDQAMALHGLTLGGTDRLRDDAYRDQIVADLAAAARGEWRGDVPFKAQGPVAVVASPAPLDHSLVSVEAPDRLGLLWAITSWFAGHGVNVVAAQLSDEDGRAKDLFLVSGSPDPEGLAAHLAREGRGTGRWWRRRRG